MAEFSRKAGPLSHKQHCRSLVYMMTLGGGGGVKPPFQSMHL